MKRICNICGNLVEKYMKECPNCGSYDFKEQENNKLRYNKRGIKI